MKSLAIFAALLLSTVAHPGKENQRANLTQNNTPDKTAPSSSYVSNQTTCPKAGDGYNKPQPPWKNPEWWLFAIAIPTLIYVGKQARSTADAAKATLLNVQAVREAERAWLSVTMGGEKLPETTNNMDVLWLTPLVTNAGRTPAHITKMYVRAVLYKSISDLPRPPVYEVNDSSGSGFGFIDGKNILTVPQQGVSPVSVCIDIKELVGVRNGTKTLCVFGYVEYKTIGHPVCVTRFCCFYHIPTGFTPLPECFVIGGYPEYNQAT
jgi:hypothetical protein